MCGRYILYGQQKKGGGRAEKNPNTSKDPLEN